MAILDNAESSTVALSPLSNDLFDVALRSGEFLLSQQVITGNLECDTSSGSCVIDDVVLISSQAAPFKLVLRRDGSRVTIEGSKNSITIAENDFFRLGFNAELTSIAGFEGLSPEHKGIPKIDTVTDSAVRPNKIRRWLVKGLSLLPGVVWFLKSVRDKVFPEPHVDFSAVEGVSFQLSSVNENTGIVKILSYDEGGIFDFHINAEGLSFPPQVAGNYYADAYSAQLFLLLNKHYKNEKWIDAGNASLRFLQRVYPQYKPAKIAWHHSDFKNAALLMIAKEFGPDSLLAPLSNYDNLVEDYYEPTNVFALRFHWRCLLWEQRNDTVHLKHAERCLDRLELDQTEDGLFHDNVDVYPDAHDLTYHQYSTVCIGLGLESHENPRARRLFTKAVAFSLLAVTPNGEPAYVGRASNNIHHSASAILSFVLAAKSEINPVKKGQYLRAVRLILGYLRGFQNAKGMLPTAMNSFVTERVAWNHCETPYNAFVGAMLMVAGGILKDLDEIQEQQIPMERKALSVANDAGFAFISNEHMYVSIFGGCAQSYGWSEGCHVTGVGGLAQLGFHDINTGCIPTLDVSEGCTISDLPVINGKVAYGRATLSKIPLVDGVCYRHQYGGAEVIRLYVVMGGELVVLTKIAPLDQCMGPVGVESLVSLSVLESDGWEHKSVESSYEIHTPGRKVIPIRYNVHGGGEGLQPKVSQSQVVSNPKGKARKVNFYPKFNLKAPVITSLVVGQRKSCIQVLVKGSELIVCCAGRDRLVLPLDMEWSLY